MTGARIAELMRCKRLNAMIAKHARRYSKLIENQEEYIQDAWLRIAEQPDDRTEEWYAEQGRKAILAAWQRRRRNRVYKKNSPDVYGITDTTKKKRIPKRAIHLFDKKYLDPGPKNSGVGLSWQYYDGEEEELQSKMVRTIKWYDNYPDFDNMPTQQQWRIVSEFRKEGFTICRMW